MVFSLANVVILLVVAGNSVCCSFLIGELLIGFSFTCSKIFGSLCFGLGDGEGTGVFNGLSRICLLINVDLLNLLLLSALTSSGECSITSA